jgi:acetylornithine deacetylase/succinyl-diaminopimelate desuccinylase-like protein
MAKISMRLVPNQDPLEVEKQFRLFLQKCAPPTIQWELHNLAGTKPAMINRHHPGVVIFGDSLQKSWGKPVAFKREGGSLPVIRMMKDCLGIDTILSGFGLPDDQIHGPNEKLHLPTWKKGVESIINFFLSYQ